MTQAKCSQDIREAQQECTRNMSAPEIYRLFQSLGLDFGPDFRTLREVQLCSAETPLRSLAQVQTTVLSIQKRLPKAYMEPHLIHPVTLDGIFQACVVALARSTRRSRTQAIVPAYTEQLWISAESASHGSYTVSSSTQRRGWQEAVSSISAVHAENGRAAILASGMRWKMVANSNSYDDEDATKDPAFGVAFKPDPTFLDRREAERLFTMRDTSDINDTRTHIKACEDLSLLYMRRFFSELGDVHNTTYLESHREKYVAWMRRIVYKSEQTSVPDTIPELESKVNQTPEGKLLIAVGQALSNIIYGDVDALKLIFEDEMAANLYRTAFGARDCYEHLERYLDTLAHKNPNMRLLEIGAGTGGATKSAMAALSRRFHQYDFTDISPSFFDQAKKTFEPHLDRMRFKTLNVERSPVEQSFENEGYDIVIAANVLHATKNMDTTLGNVRSLLRPGGKLVLYEYIGPQFSPICLVFGLLPGWWLSEEDTRQWGPLMSSDSWHNHLIASGFDGGIDLELHDFPHNPECQLSSILVAGVNGNQAPGVRTSSNYVCVTSPEASALQLDIAKRMADAFGAEMVNLNGKLALIDIKDKVCVVLAELDGPVLRHMTSSTLAALKQMTKHGRAIYWLNKEGSGTTSDPDLDLILGFSRVARTERPELVFTTVSFEGDATIDVVADRTTSILNHAGDETSFRIINGDIHIPRFVDAEHLTQHIRQQTTTSTDIVQVPIIQEDQTRALAVEVGTVGLLDTLRFKDDVEYHQTPLGTGEVEFKTMAIGINFRDLATILGQIPHEGLGLDAAGVVTRTGPESEFQVGDRVFGLCFGTVAMNTYCRTPGAFLARVPDHVSWAEAASIPVVYTTGYTCLFDMGTVESGDTVLIHSAAGALGQAAIQMCQFLGAQVFVTVGSVEKREFLEETYGIPADHIFSSRDLSFRDGVKRVTGSRGVDVVLNSLSGDALRAGWDCIAPGGRFVELGKMDVAANAHLPMGSFAKNARFEYLDFLFLIADRPARASRLFRRMVDFVFNQLGKSATSKMPITMFPFSQLQDALRLMQSGKHVGKLVIEPRVGDIVPIVKASSAREACRFDLTASYLICGAFGGLGRSIVRWMAERGARNFILLSRRGAAQDDQARRVVVELERMGATVSAPPCDVTDTTALQQVLEQSLSSMPPIRGCIQGTMVLKDSLFQDMSLDDWNTAISPKVQGSWNLHNVLLGHDLDFFIMLSSIAGLTGNAGQSSYAAGSSFQDSLAHYRASKGLPAATLDLPLLEDVGFVADRPELLDHLRNVGWATMNEDEFHAALDYHCRRQQARGGSDQALSRVQVAPRLRPFIQLPSSPVWHNDPLFNHLIRTAETATTRNGQAKKSDKQEVKLAVALAAAVSSDAAERIVLDALVGKLARVLSVDLADIDGSKALHEHGVDSLVAVEIRSWLSKEVGAELSVFDITSKSSILQLAGLAAGKSRFRKGGGTATAT